MSAPTTPDPKYNMTAVGRANVSAPQGTLVRVLPVRDRSQTPANSPTFGYRVRTRVSLEGLEQSLPPVHSSAAAVQTP
jgi:hypothetical protein